METHPTFLSMALQMSYSRGLRSGEDGAYIWLSQKSFMYLSQVKSFCFPQIPWSSWYWCVAEDDNRPRSTIYFLSYLVTVWATVLEWTPTIIRIALGHGQDR
uniref:Uncharacterized protein n=1 Tax=Lepeophtheirus salmonis TaxID=72036 RepID=A0A0K2UWS6_LEPSM